MWKKLLFITIALLGTCGGGFFWAKTSETLLFDTALWVIVAAIALGVLLGVIRAKLKGRERIENGAVVRWGGGAFLEHWATAIGILALIATSFFLGILFIIPTQVETTAEALFPLNLHFIGVVLMLFGGFFFAADFLVSRNYSALIPNPQEIWGGFFGKYFLRRKWSTEGKYLASQKAAFLAFAILGTVVLTTGAIKVFSHFTPVQASVIGITTYIHDLFALPFILMLIVHILVVLALKPHWPALKSAFTGKVREQYVKKEHPIWYEELNKDE